MPNAQTRTYQTAGELKKDLQNIPDDAKLSFGDQQSSMGLNVEHRQDRVIFSVGSQQGRQQG